MQMSLAGDLSTRELKSRRIRPPSFLRRLSLMPAATLNFLQT